MQLLEALDNGDVHSDNAKLIFGREVAKASEERTFAKSFKYRWIYTAPNRPTSLDPGQLRTYRVAVDPAMIAQATEAMNRAHPRIVAWKHQRIAELHRTMLVRNPWGRYRNLTWAMKAGKDDTGLAWREHAEQVALNFPVQTSVGEVMNDAFIQAWDTFTALAGGTGSTVWRAYDNARMLALHDPAPRTRIIVQCHDALVATCPNEQVPQVAQVLKQAMEQPHAELGGAYLPVEIKVGETWGSVEPWRTEPSATHVPLCIC